MHSVRLPGSAHFLFFNEFVVFYSEQRRYFPSGGVKFWTFFPLCTLLRPGSPLVVAPGPACRITSPQPSALFKMSDFTDVWLVSLITGWSAPGQSAGLLLKYDDNNYPPIVVNGITE